MKIGVFIENFNIDFKEAVEKAALFGCQGAQIYVGENLSDSEIKEKLDIITSNGLEVASLCGDIGGFSKPELNYERVELSKRILEIGLKFGTNIVTTHIGKLTAEESEQNEIIRKVCRELALFGDSIGATFAVETGPEPAPVLYDFLESLGANGMRVNFDPANLVMVSGDNAAEAVKTLGKYIVHTHAKDGIMIGNKEGRREKILGEGNVNFDEYLPALASTGFDGYVTIEREAGNDQSDIIEREVNFLKEKLDKFGLR